MADNRILSTGVFRSPAPFELHVEVLNLDPNDTHTVTVKILDWGIDQVWNDPTPVPVSPSGPTAIGPHTNQAFVALITQAIGHYEIRIILPRDKDLVVNCFAIESGGRIIEGNTVRHRELVEVERV